MFRAPHRGCNGEEGRGCFRVKASKPGLVGDVYGEPQGTKPQTPSIGCSEEHRSFCRMHLGGDEQTSFSLSQPVPSLPGQGS